MAFPNTRELLARAFGCQPEEVDEEDIFAYLRFGTPPATDTFEGWGEKAHPCESRLPGGKMTDPEVIDGLISS